MSHQKGPENEQMSSFFILWDWKKKRALLQYNLCTLAYTCGKCILMLFNKFIVIITIENISITPKSPSCSFCHLSLLLTWLRQPLPFILPLSLAFSAKHTWIPQCSPFVSGISCLLWRFSAPSMLQQTSAAWSVLFLSVLPLCGRAVVCLCVHQRWAWGYGQLSLLWNRLQMFVYINLWIDMSGFFVCLFV